MKIFNSTNTQCGMHLNVPAIRTSRPTPHRSHRQFKQLITMQIEHPHGYNTVWCKVRTKLSRSTSSTIKQTHVNIPSIFVQGKNHIYRSRNLNVDWLSPGQLVYPPERVQYFSQQIEVRLAYLWPHSHHVEHYQKNFKVKYTAPQTYRLFVSPGPPAATLIVPSIERRYICR